MPELMMPTAYIPTLDGEDRLREVLIGLRRQTSPCHVVVIDNGGKSGTENLLQSEFPEFEYFRPDHNEGFGLALNHAISSRGDGPVLLLNDDLKPQADFVANMMAVFDRGEPVVAGVLLRDDGTDTIDSAGVVADRETLTAFDYLEGQPLTAVEEASPPLGPTGGAALFDREAFNEVGGFDERIFAYYEDLDLALRLRAAGYGCAIAIDARAIHRRSSTLGARSARKYGMTGWSRGYLLRRYGVFESLRPAIRTIAFETVVVAGQLLVDHTTAGLRGRIRGWREAGGMPKRARVATGLGDYTLRQSIRARIRRYF